MSDEEAQTPLTDLLAPASIRLDARAADRDDAIRQAGAALVEAGAVDPSYVDAMLERENSVSTFVGEGVAIPHGTLAGKDAVKDDAIVVLRFPDGVDWDGNPVSFVIGIAGKGDEHLDILSQIALLFSDEDDVARLKAASTPEELYELLASVNA